MKAPLTLTSQLVKNKWKWKWKLKREVKVLQEEAAESVGCCNVFPFPPRMNRMPCHLLSSPHPSGDPFGARGIDSRFRHGRRGINTGGKGKEWLVLHKNSWCLLTHYQESVTGELPKKSTENVFVQNQNYL